MPGLSSCPNHLRSSSGVASGTMGSIANAALNGDKDMLHMLVQIPHNDINEKDLDGQTAVHVAAFMGRLVAFYTIYNSP